MAIFKGAGVAIVTPMTETEEVNYPKLAELLDYQIENGTDAIIICGTTGESSTLTHEEHLEAIRFTVEHVAGRVPVVAGTGSNCTRTAVYLSQEAEKSGADGLLLVSPYYNKATQKGLAAHFKTIADSVKLPVILYNIQGRTGVNIAPETLAWLAKNVENIVGVKEASNSITQVAKIAQLTDGALDIYSGNDDQIVPILSLGGVGVISVLSNIAPRETHDIVAKYLAGDVEGSRDLQLKALPLVEKLFCEVNPIPVKAALNMMGWEVGPVRMPLTVMEEEHQRQLKAEMDRYNEAARTGVDPDFGRTRFTQTIEKPPFYFGRERFDVHYTCGGVAITTAAAVKRENGETIPGLFAAGEVTGGVHGRFRLGGNGLTDAFVFGRIAGASAAAHAKTMEAADE